MISNCNPSPRFDINITSGEVILLHEDLDRENISEYTVTLTAKDKGNFKATTQLTITITDVNDHPPEFSKNEYILTFDEGSDSILPMFYVLVGHFLIYSLP